MELPLAIAVGVLVLLLALAVRRAHVRGAALADVAGRLGARSTDPGVVFAAAERLEARTREAEEQLARATTDLQLMGEALSVGVIRLDRDGRVDLANPAAHALLEVPPGRLVGRSVMEAFVDARAEALVVAARGSGAAAVELGRGQRGAQRLAVAARRSPTGGTWILVEDITELTRLRQIRTEFIDNLSHELRTPLTTVSLLAETLAREASSADLPERMRDRIAKIEVETGHLVQMVSELLELSRIESGSALALRDGVDLSALAASSAERLRLFAERQGVTLEVASEPGVPPVRGDEARLGQVLVNLLHNAVKFSHEGGRVRIHVGSEGRQVVVAVADEGVGIPRADRPRVFERFYKVDRARVRGGGTGLGLAIARHVVEGHGGRIWVESEESVGSTFRFTVPLTPADAAPPDPAGVTGPGQAWAATAPAAPSADATPGA